MVVIIFTTCECGCGKTIGRIFLCVFANINYSLTSESLELESSL